MIKPLRRLLVMGTLIGMSDYVNDNMNHNWSDFELKPPMTYLENFTTKLCVTCVPPNCMQHGFITKLCVV